MDRREALKLLRGGEDGVRKWNRQRGEGEDIAALASSTRVTPRFHPTVGGWPTAPTSRANERSM